MLYRKPCEMKKFRRSINPFLPNVPILYPLKTPKKQRFSGVFKGYKVGTLARNGLKNVIYVDKHCQIFLNCLILVTRVTSLYLNYKINETVKFNELL